MADGVFYRSCWTCGRVMALQGESKQVYCSPECARENRRCPVCGGYFDKGAGVVAFGDWVVCSTECAAVEPRYASLLKENP